MLIAIISDTHGNSATFKKFADWAKQNNIKEIVHCGDIGFADFAKEMCRALPGIKFHLVIGNMDNDSELIGNLSANGQLPNAVFYGDIGKTEINGKKIAFTHFPEDAKKLAQAGQFDLVFFGHTHAPSEEKIGACRLINPGNLTGQIYRSTFAVYDTAKDYLELKITDTV
jgi:hypothetical protein